MILKFLNTGLFSSNCYIIGDKEEGVLIDAGADSKDILKIAANNGLNIKQIILTHGHIDHICFALKVKEETGAEILIHEEDAHMLTDGFLNGAEQFGISIDKQAADKLLSHNSIVEAGGLKLEIIHTPGHTPGGICVKVSDYVFTGDTLFKGSIGRTDLPGGSYDILISSLNERLMSLNNEIKVYPGHGPATDIGHERMNNPFLRRFF